MTSIGWSLFSRNVTVLPPVRPPPPDPDPPLERIGTLVVKKILALSMQDSSSQSLTYHATILIYTNIFTRTDEPTILQSGQGDAHARYDTLHYFMPISEQNTLVSFKTKPVSPFSSSLPPEGKGKQILNPFHSLPTKQHNLANDLVRRKRRTCVCRRF